MKSDRPPSEPPGAGEGASRPVTPAVRDGTLVFGVVLAGFVAYAFGAPTSYRATAVIEVSQAPDGPAVVWPAPADASSRLRRTALDPGFVAELARKEQLDPAETAEQIEAGIKSQFTVETSDARRFTTTLVAATAERAQRLCNDLSFRAAEGATAILGPQPPPPRDASASGAAISALLRFLEAHPGIAAETQPAAKGQPGGSDALTIALRSERKRIEERLAKPMASSDNPYAETPEDHLLLNRRLKEIDGVLEARSKKVSAKDSARLSQEVRSKWQNLLQAALDERETEPVKPPPPRLKATLARASLPSAPIKPDRPLVVLLGLVVAGLVGVTAAIVRSAVERRRVWSAAGEAGPERRQRQTQPLMRTLRLDTAPAAVPPPIAPEPKLQGAGARSEKPGVTLPLASVRPLAPPEPTTDPLASTVASDEAQRPAPAPVEPAPTTLIANPTPAPPKVAEPEPLPLPEEPPPELPREPPAPAPEPRPPAPAPPPEAMPRVARKAPTRTTQIYGTPPPPAETRASRTTQAFGTPAAGTPTLNEPETSHPRFKPTPVPHQVLSSTIPPPRDGSAENSDELSSPQRTNRPLGDTGYSYVSSPPPPARSRTPLPFNRSPSSPPSTQPLGTQEPVAAEGRLSPPAGVPRFVRTPKPPDPVLRPPPPPKASVTAMPIRRDWAFDPSLKGARRRELCDQILPFAVERCFVVGVTAVDEARELKARVACELALALSDARHPRVLLLEADFQWPELHQLMKIEVPMSAGFSQQLHARLQGRAEPSWRVVECTPSLHVLAEGVMRTPGLILTVQFDESLRSLATYYDIIVVDGPPVTAEADCRALSGVVDGIVIVSPAAGSQDIGRAAQLFPDKRFSHVLGV